MIPRGVVFADAGNDCTGAQRPSIAADKGWPRDDARARRLTALAARAGREEARRPPEFSRNVGRGPICRARGPQVGRRGS